ncbi:MAG: hypothetical protein R2744_08300 [Bacteroidales bacterium]
MTEKLFTRRMFILPGLVAAFLFFGSFTSGDINRNSSTDADYQFKNQADKKEMMFEVLESLENGVPYQKEQSWSDNRYDEIEFPGFCIPDPGQFKYDFDFSLPQFRFNEIDLERFELKMEELSRKLEEKLEEMSVHLDSVINSK